MFLGFQGRSGPQAFDEDVMNAQSVCIEMNVGRRTFAWHAEVPPLDVAAVRIRGG